MQAKIKNTGVCRGSALLSAVGNAVISRNYPYGALKDIVIIESAKRKKRETTKATEA